MPESRLINITRWSLITFLVCIYCFSFVVPLLNSQKDFGDYIFPFKELTNLVFAVCIFLINYFVLIPELFVKKHFVLYSVSVIILILMIIGQQIFTEYQFLNEVQDHFLTQPVMAMAIDSAPAEPALVQAPPDETPFSMPLMQHVEPAIIQSRFFMDIILPQTLLKSAFLALIIFFTGGFFTAGIRWLRTDILREELEKKQLESELKFLKAQINPHFLFNALNSIYMLTKKDADQARVGILHMSSFLRYLLRASELRHVPVQLEVEAIEDYISLQKTRLPGHVNLNCKIVKTEEPLVIEPMLLLPLIENVFKHGIDPEMPCNININLNIQGNELRLITVNPVLQHPVKPVSGIGIRNIESRLAISYSDCSELAYIQSSREFIVKLFIRLDNELHYH